MRQTLSRISCGRENGNLISEKKKKTRRRRRKKKKKLNYVQVSQLLLSKIVGLSIAHGSHAHARKRSVQFFIILLKLIDMHHTYRYSQNTYTSVQGYNKV